MKEWFYFIFIIFGLISIISCEKETIYPTDELPANIPSASAFKGISMWGEFVVIDAVMYMRNVQTGEKRWYHHFDSNKDTSSLRFGGPIREIELLVNNRTSYSFYKPIGQSSYGDFVLNNDTSKHYDIWYQGLNKTIIDDYNNSQGLMNGSGLRFSGQTISEADSTVAIQIFEDYVDEWKYWTQLTMKKVRSW
jgi:hypothetical protein